MTEHAITVDEDACIDCQAKWAAFCTDECGWKSRWFHADEFDHLDDPADAANLAAEDAGEAHVRDMAHGADVIADNARQDAFFRRLTDRGIDPYAPATD